MSETPRDAPRRHQRRQRHEPAAARHEPQPIHISTTILPEGMSVRRKTVLVVDSEEQTRERIAATLKRDYRVVRAASGEAALTQMEREEVDLVLADASLPGISGFELLRIVRANYPFAESILLSAGSDLDGAVQAIKLGAYHY